MDAAFQSDAFQNDAFQANFVIVVDATAFAAGTSEADARLSLIVIFVFNAQGTSDADGIGEAMFAGTLLLASIDLYALLNYQDVREYGELSIVAIEEYPKLNDLAGISINRWSS